jgi:N-methylhydantoinase A
VLVPARPGITNALGCVVADLRHDFVNTVNQPVATVEEARVRDILERHRAEGAALIAKEAVQPETIRYSHSADMQFVGQTHILNVPLPSVDASRDLLQRLFEEAYFARFKVELPEIRANLVNLNTSVIGVRPAVDLSRLIDPNGRAGTLEAALREIRPVWYDGTWHDTPVYAREKLPLDAVIQGPAILEQMDATTVLEPGDWATTDADGNIVIEVGR